MTLLDFINLSLLNLSIEKSRLKTNTKKLKFIRQICKRRLELYLAIE